MSCVSSRELRNETRKLLDRAAAGEDVVITVRGRPAARLIAVERKPRWVNRDDFVETLIATQADATLRLVIDDLAPDATDALDP